MQTTELGLSYLHTTLAFTVSGVDIDDDVRFFDSHFTRHPVKGPVTATVAIRRTGPLTPPGATTPIFVRRSRTEFFTVRALRCDRTGELYCERSSTRMAFQPSLRRVHLDVPALRPGRELIEIIRSLVLRNEENHGVVMVHAAVVEPDGRAVVIVGPKGAGKTSAALELILHQGGRMLSGDKALLLPGADPLLVAGWPDWPHVGLGTISRFQPISTWFDLDQAVDAARGTGDLWSMRHKIPLDPDGYRTVVPFASPAPLPVAAILYPSVAPNQPVRFVRCCSHAARLAANIESSFASGTTGWNPLIAPSARLTEHWREATARAARLPAFELRGDGAVPPPLVAELLAS